MRKTHPLSPSLQSYFYRYLSDIKGVSPHTILAYRDSLKTLICFAADNLHTSPDLLQIEDLTEDLIVAFLHHLEKVMGNSVTTRNARLAAVRSFFGFLGRENPELLDQCRRVRLISNKRTEHQHAQYLDRAEMKAIFDAIPLHSHIGFRDRALLLVLYNTGARVTELVELTIEDLRLEPPTQVKMLGKGRKQRACPLWPEAVSALKNYLHIRAPKDVKSRRLFLNANGYPITRFGVRYIVRRYAQIASAHCPSLKNKAVSPHIFRHSTAMHLLQAGNDINMVRLWLGHANINTTHTYIELDMELKRKILETTFPRESEEKDRKSPSWRAPQVLEWLDNLSRQVSTGELDMA